MILTYDQEEELKSILRENLPQLGEPLIVSLANQIERFIDEVENDRKANS